jgi:diadenosine tetraphosphate (Ap4A) HIT family hydrolase
MTPSPCPFCEADGGLVLWRDEAFRVVLPEEAGYPGFCRVVANVHAREATDLPPDSRRRMMDVVFATEEAIRVTLSPWKVNLASLGNVAPHVHWHVVPRNEDDPRYPDPIWGPPKRPIRSAGADAATTARLRDELARRLGPTRASTT